ncbi:MAG: hypothetical protein ACOYU7_01540 [Bacillota bacterium]
MAGQLQTIWAKAVPAMFGVKAKVVTLNRGDYRYNEALAWGDERWVEVEEPTGKGLLEGYSHSPERGFWKEFKGLHSKLQDGQVDWIPGFYRQYGAFCPDRKDGEPLGYVREALTWFNSLVTIYDDARKGKPDHLRHKLTEAGYWGRKKGAPRRADGSLEEPFSITLGSCPEFLFRVNAAYRPKEGIWVTPETDKEIIEESYAVVFNVLMDRLPRLKFTAINWQSGDVRAGYVGRYDFKHALAFQADNPLDFALLQWYLEEMAGRIVPRCVCGQPIPQGRRKWCSRECEDMHKKRARRAARRAGSATTTKGEL